MEINQQLVALIAVIGGIFALLINFSKAWFSVIEVFDSENRTTKKDYLELCEILKDIEKDDQKHQELLEFKEQLRYRAVLGIKCVNKDIVLYLLQYPDKIRAKNYYKTARNKLNFINNRFEFNEIYRIDCIRKTLKYCSVSLYFILFLIGTLPWFIPAFLPTDLQVHVLTQLSSIKAWLALAIFSSTTILSAFMILSYGASLNFAEKLVLEAFSVPDNSSQEFEFEV